MQISLEEKENPSEGTISHAIGCKYCIGVSSISATIFQKGLLMLMMACFLVILSHQAEKCIIFVHVRQRACKVNQSSEKKRRAPTLCVNTVVGNSLDVRISKCRK